MNYTLNEIAGIIGAEGSFRDGQIDHLLLDSRRITAPGSSLFFALKGNRRDGHSFIQEVYKKGVRNFVVSEPGQLTGANFLVVDDTLVALQQLTARHRSRFAIPVIGITGSNGKTIVKEWLYQILHSRYHIVRSPRSFNSQVGVPLSVWQMNETHTLGIFEAGISEQGEMNRLERIIQPTIGIITNIGEAHAEGFNDASHKFREKLVLFKNSKVVIGREIDFDGQDEFFELLNADLRRLTWGVSSDNHFILRSVEKMHAGAAITIGYGGQNHLIQIPFSDDASVENAITCCCLLWELGLSTADIAEGMLHLQPVNMRLELKKGMNNCSVINDSYSADLSSLEIALNFLDQQSANQRKTVILSDFLQSGLDDLELYARILASINKHHVTRLIGIGEKISSFAFLPVSEQGDEIEIELYPSTAEFIRLFRSSSFHDETILVKGARIFAFEEIVRVLEQKVHQTVLEINLNAIADNLKEYRNILQPNTKIMAMVKAFAYGSGGAEIAGILQYHKADYLGVAYADEGVELRRAGITLPIMVMNPEENAFETIVENELEPEIYSFKMLESFNDFLKQEGAEEYPVHIEIETGMNRLGFAAGDMTKLANALTQMDTIKVVSVFSHLASSEESSQDDFTMKQYELFSKASDELRSLLGYPFLCHIANSAATARMPQLQMDMVRLGIGLYGIDSSNSNKLKLQPVATLRSTIAQLKYLQPGDSVSYNRKAIVERNSTIATIRIGYADGYPRRLGNGIGKMWIPAAGDKKGTMAPVIGAVCMDMIMIDVTGIDVKDGDEVIVFGAHLPLQELAGWAGTIPYEIMTGISQRVKRVYFEE